MSRKVSKKICKKVIARKKAKKEPDDLYISIGKFKFPLKQHMINDMVDGAIESIYEDEAIVEELDGIVLTKLKEVFTSTDFLKDKEIKNMMRDRVTQTLDYIFDDTLYFPEKTKKRIANMKDTILEELTDKELKKLMKKKLMSL